MSDNIVSTFFDGITRDLLIHGKFMYNLMQSQSTGTKWFGVFCFKDIPISSKTVNCKFILQEYDDKQLWKQAPWFIPEHDSKMFDTIDDRLNDSTLITCFISFFHNETRYKRLVSFPLQSCENFKHEKPNFLNAFVENCENFDKVSRYGLICSFCKCSETDTKFKRCSACQAIVYCSIQCQKKDWKHHKILCSERTKDTKEKCASRKCVSFRAWNTDLTRLHVLKNSI